MKKRKDRERQKENYFQVQNNYYVGDSYRVRTSSITDVLEEELMEGNSVSSSYGLKGRSNQQKSKKSFKF